MNKQALFDACERQGRRRVPLYVDSCESTQDLVKTWGAGQQPHGAALIAGRQTAGRGRLGRTWELPAEAGLQLSVLLRPSFPLKRLPLLPLLAAVALREACGAGQIKWPNDLLSPEGLKFAGILAEAELSNGRIDFVVLGIGVNLTAHPAEIPQATHLSAFAPSPHPADLAVTFLQRLEQGLSQLQHTPSELLATWKQYSATLGSDVRVGEVQGMAEDVAEDGALLLRLHDGRLHRVLAGDVEMVRITETD